MDIRMRVNRVGGRAPIVGGIFMLIGMILLIGGLWLSAIGGSWYYLLVGVALCVCGGLMWRGMALCGDLCSDRHMGAV